MIHASSYEGGAQQSGLLHGRLTAGAEPVGLSSCRRWQWLHASLVCSPDQDVYARVQIDCSRWRQVACKIPSLFFFWMPLRWNGNRLHSALC
jgi:hypothetical protein